MQVLTFFNDLDNVNYLNKQTIKVHIKNAYIDLWLDLFLYGTYHG